LVVVVAEPLPRLHQFTATVVPAAELVVYCLDHLLLQLAQQRIV
jgi:hypothetical protein